MLIWSGYQLMPLISALIKAVQVQLVATVCQHIAKSIGGNSSKMHLAVDAHGNPIEFIVGDGVTHDIKIAPELLGLLNLKNTEFLNADKGYDSEAFRELIHSQGVHANIPRKKNAKTSNGHMDWLIYQARHVVEKTFASLKHQRLYGNHPL